MDREVAEYVDAVVLHARVLLVGDHSAKNAGDGIRVQNLVLVHSVARQVAEKQGDQVLRVGVLHLAQGADELVDTASLCVRTGTMARLSYKIQKQHADQEQGLF